jgi:hypothetical protein
MLLLLIAAVGAVGGYVWWRAAPSATGRGISLAQLQLTAQELNRDLPRAVDPGTELTSVIASEGRLTYNQRLISLLAAEVPASFAQSMRPGIVSAACSTPELRDTFLRAGVTLRWSYADRVGQPVAQIEVRPQDCGF